MNDELTKKYEGIKKDIAGLRDELEELASLSTDQLEEYKDVAMGHVRGVVKGASDETEKRIKQIDKYSRENPWVVAAGLSVAGIILGMLLSHKSRD